MNARRINVVKLVGEDGRVRVGSASTTLAIYGTFHDFLENRGGKVKFSRRPFAGAIRETFVRKDAYEDFEGETTGVDLCSWRCNQKLGVGNKTLKFTVWYKQV